MNIDPNQHDAEVVSMLANYAESVEKPLILMDSLNAMLFKHHGTGGYCEPELVPPGTKIDIIGELTSPETGDFLGDKATTTIEQVIKSDDLTWDMLVIEGDNAIYAGLGLDRRLELIKTPDKDDFDLSL